MATKINHYVMFYKYHTPPHLNERVLTYIHTESTVQYQSGGRLFWRRRYLRTGAVVVVVLETLEDGPGGSRLASCGITTTGVPADSGTVSGVENSAHSLSGAVSNSVEE